MERNTTFTGAADQHGRRKIRVAAVKSFLRARLEMGLAQLTCT